MQLGLKVHTWNKVNKLNEGIITNPWVNFDPPHRGPEVNVHLPPVSLWHPSIISSLDASASLYGQELTQEWSSIRFYSTVSIGENLFNLFLWIFLIIFRYFDIIIIVWFYYIFMIVELKQRKTDLEFFFHFCQSFGSTINFSNWLTILSERCFWHLGN